MTSRSWRWLKTRILGLLSAPIGRTATGAPIFSTRLQVAVLGATPVVDLREEG